MKKVVSGNYALERWEGLSNMKYFYACPDIPVNHQEIRLERHRYWDCEQHIYKESRLVFLDTRKPGDKTLPEEKPELVKERFEEWTVYPGQLKSTSASMIEDASLAVTRKLRLQEEKEMKLKESLARQKIIEAQIEAAKNNAADSGSTTVKGTKRTKKPAVETSSKKGSREAVAKVPTASASGHNSSGGVTDRDIKLIIAEIAELKRINNKSQFGSAVQQPATVSKRHHDLDEEDAKLQLAQKKRKLAEEDLQTTQAVQAKNRLELEARDYERKLQRESEVHRVKLKVQADEIEDESARRRTALADEERRRRYTQEDQQRRQEMEFATEDHALKIHKEKANMRMAASSQQHEQQLQLLFASQQPNNLAMLLGNMGRQKSRSATPAAFEDSFHKPPRPTSTSSSQPTQQKEANAEDVIKKQILQKLMQDLQDEKDLQQQMRENEEADDADEEEEA